MRILVERESSSEGFFLLSCELPSFLLRVHNLLTNLLWLTNALWRLSNTSLREICVPWD